LTQISRLKAGESKELEFMLIKKNDAVSKIKVEVRAPQIFNVEKEIEESK